VKLVIFDVDGTLLDNRETEERCYTTAPCEGFGLTALDTDCRAMST